MNVGSFDFSFQQQWCSCSRFVLLSAWRHFCFMSPFSYVNSSDDSSIFQHYVYVHGFDFCFLQHRCCCSFSFINTDAFFTASFSPQHQHNIIFLQLLSFEDVFLQFLLIFIFGALISFNKCWYLSSLLWFLLLTAQMRVQFLHVSSIDDNVSSFNFSVVKFMSLASITLLNSVYEFSML